MVQKNQHPCTVAMYCKADVGLYYNRPCVYLMCGALLWLFAGVYQKHKN